MVAEIRGRGDRAVLIQRVATDVMDLLPFYWPDLIEDAMEAKVIQFFVPAAPVPKGSAKAFKHFKTGKIIVTQDNRAKQKTFANIAAPYINQAMAGKSKLDGAVSIILHFYVPKPKSVMRHFPTVKPDLDKYARLILDVLTGKIWNDDGQVCKLECTKEYGDKGGVEIIVSEVAA